MIDRQVRRCRLVYVRMIEWFKDEQSPDTTFQFNYERWPPFSGHRSTSKSTTNHVLGMSKAVAERVDIWNQGLKNAIDVYDYFRRIPSRS
jgi:hypothetical protein